MIIIEFTLFNAKALVVRYVDDRYSSMEIYEVSNREEEDGYISVRINKERSEENKFKAMFFLFYNS